MLDHLWVTYGSVTHQQVQDHTAALHRMPHDVSEPVDKIFNAIEDLADLAEHAKVPMTEAQKVHVAYLCFISHQAFQHDFCVWNDKPQADRTWET